MAKRKRNRTEKQRRQEKRRERRTAKEAGGPRGQHVSGHAAPLQHFKRRAAGMPSALVHMLEESESATEIRARPYAKLGRALAEFDLVASVSAIAGLLTVPQHQIGTIRIEMMLHLAMLHCRGTALPTTAHLRRWLEQDLAKLPIRRMEDPLEDVFVSNVIAPGGNYRIFEGVWESSDHGLQATIEVLAQTSFGQIQKELLVPVMSLLRISEEAAERAAVPRWTLPDQHYPADKFLQESLNLDELRRRVHFTWDALKRLGVEPKDLEPFLLRKEQRDRLRTEAVGHSSLERHPLLRLADGVLLICPTAVSPAIRRFVVEQCRASGDLPEFQQALRMVHGRAVYGTELDLVDAPRHIGATLAPQEREARPGPPLPWDEVHCPIDVDKIAHVILLQEDLTDLPERGLTTTVPDRRLSTRLAPHIRGQVQRHQASARGGLVVLVSGGMGSGSAVALPVLPPRWHVVVMSAANFSTFAWSADASLLRLWKLYEQMAFLEATGTEVHDFNGTLNTYAYWARQDFMLCPTGFAYPPEGTARIVVGTDFIRDFRVAERRLNDVHAARVDRRGNGARVRRLSRSAYFPAMLRRPLYAAQGFIQSGRLAGVLQYDGLSIWVTAPRPTQAPEASDFVYKIWDAALSWLDRLVPQLKSAIQTQEGTGRRGQVLHLRIELTEESLWRTVGELSRHEAERPSAIVNHARQTAVIALPLGFTQLLARVENDGERALVETMAEAILLLLEAPGSGTGEAAIDLPRGSAVDAVAAAMRGTATRFIHLWSAAQPTDYLATLSPGWAEHPRLLAPEDAASWQLGLAWRVLDRRELQDAAGASVPRTAVADERKGEGPNDEVLELIGREACAEALKRVVDDIWVRIESRLVEISGPSLVKLTLENLEAVFRDREQWRRTARAVIALYGEEDDVNQIAAERESERSAASNAGRVLIEMAVCTCPVEGGRVASLTDLDDLIAGVHVLILQASDSDAIFSGLTEPVLRAAPNGVLAANRSFLESIVNPFMIEAHTTEFQRAAEEYHKLYDRTSARGGFAGTGPAREFEYEPEFRNAFLAEYGFDVDRLLDGLGELTDMGMEARSSVVMTSRGEVIARLKKQRQFDQAEAEAMLGMLGLMRRDAWSSAPEGYRARDWQPWRFRRRLSLVARPLVAFGAGDDAPVVFGMHQLGASVSYLFENIRSAWLPEEFFASAAMSRYRGQVVKQEGGAFTMRVASVLAAAGWEVRTEVQMRTVGAPKKLGLGDLDVLAWRDGDSRVLLIECKRLQPARTIGEIAELLKQFRGEVGDRLGKHVARYQWLREHPQGLRTVGVPVDSPILTPLLVTNRDVPMRFVANLPIPPEQVVSVDRLIDRLKRPTPD